MDKKILSSVLRRMHLATREHVGVEAIWKIMMVTAIIIFAMLMGGGWYIYSWGITENAVINKVKPVSIPITEEELARVEEDVAQRSEHYERVLATAPEVVPISGNIKTPTTIQVATTTPLATTTATTTKK
ncbi:MAG TPA: hypothetical protein VJ579_01545 [Candidatus Paceibacterota bacterium]|nr:hypothetical protein [Candidatus Paceibacterota bacterium]